MSTVKLKVMKVTHDKKKSARKSFELTTANTKAVRKLPTKKQALGSGSITPPDGVDLSDVPLPIRETLRVLAKGEPLEMWEQALLIDAVWNHVVNSPCLILCRLLGIDHDTAHLAMDELAKKLGFQEHGHKCQSITMKGSETIQ